MQEKAEIRKNTPYSAWHATVNGFAESDMT